MKIEYIRSERRTMAIEVTRDAKVLVRLPKKCSDAKACAFVKSHEEWILAHVQRAKERSLLHPPTDEKVLRKEAKAYIPKRVKYFSELTGLYPTALHITSARTRFGSCSGKNSVNFSVYLMQYSKGAVDYVILHELCHIRHKNHGKEFYALIGQYMPDYQKYIKELKE